MSTVTEIPPDHKLCEAPGCDEVIPKLSSRGNPRTGCCSLHTYQAVRARDPDRYRGYRRASQRRNTRRKTGRRCRWCLIEDGEVRVWSQANESCAACQRTSLRNGRCACGHPLRGERRLCSSCDADFHRTLGHKMIVLISPPGTPERERVVWRAKGPLLMPKDNSPFKGVFDLGDVEDEEVLYIEATPKMWRTVR